MWLKSVQLTNIKGFADSGVIEFSQGINILVGANNSGKSTILRSIHQMQPFSESDGLFDFFRMSIRRGADHGAILWEFIDVNFQQLTLPRHGIRDRSKVLIQFDVMEGSISAKSTYTVPAGTPQIISLPTSFCPQKEPNNFLYQYFSRRKPAVLEEQVTSQNAEMIQEAIQHLSSKIDRLCDSDSPYFQIFRDACHKTLGFNISCVQSGKGKQVGLRLVDGKLLAIDAMGEGTMNTLFLLAHLCMASGKLFLIEEIENDLHPKLLKSLLELIIQKSDTNQFIISTHSNIVTKYLGSVPNARLFSVEMKLDVGTRIPISTCQPISEKPEDRIQTLENLGYELFDFDLWKGYLILEESTAERLIKDFFIPFMVPKLQGRLQTIASGGVDDVEARLSDFMRLFVFIHTSPQYNGKAWVAVDGDGKGKNLIAGLKNKFKSWPEEHFKCFTAENFEHYYPDEFKNKVAEILAMPHGQNKQKAKGKLAGQVLDWALANKKEAAYEFSTCAKEVLDFLEEIAAKLT